MPGSHARQTDVLVVGAGPAGLVAAITLARDGADVLLVEMRDEISSLSRALVISTRTMEILRSWGVEDDVRAGAADVEPRAWVTATLASAEGVEVPLGYPTAAEAAEVSPTRPAWAPQDHLEPILLALLRVAATVEVRFETELVALAQGDGVEATVVDRQSGRRYRVDASYIIGADGAHSTVRAQLGIAMDGPDAMDEYHRVEFRAPLAEVAGDRRYGLYVITHPDAACVLAPRGAGDRWGLSKEWRAGQPRMVDQDDEELTRLVATAAGVPGLRPVLERRSSFSFAAQIADRYQDGCGFLVGDAAHRMTPRGGTGMNTAIQDAYDIAWKLGWVVRGWAGPELLQSYETERRPVGLHNVERAGSPDGARRNAEDALPWDLNGRLAHHWMRRGEETVSTLDLLGEGVTVLAGPGRTAAIPRMRAPVVTHVLDESTASALAIATDGALVLRPDGQALDGHPAVDGELGSRGEAGTR